MFHCDISLYPHQTEAVKKMHNGCILCGGVGTGKSRTALYYYWERVLAKKALGPPLYIITTARKRDTKDWEAESKDFPFNPKTIDSWNNIKKYIGVHDAFFIFDEQRVVGYGAWAKSFLKIAAQNRWILLTATPGDTWMDYIPVFIANGFYRNKTDFVRQHVIYSRYSKFPKPERFVNTGKLIRQRNDIVVPMAFQKKTIAHEELVNVPYDRELTKRVLISRWDIYRNEPIRDAAGLCFVLRRITNSDEARIMKTELILMEHPKAIIFYSFNYELNLLREMAKRLDICCAEWNGQKHEPLPSCERWIYLVQYTAGAEGWNCTTTDTMIFYSQHYSYKIMAQAAGRIDRLNTPYTDLYYYHLCSKSAIDMAIRKAVKEKRTFNETLFAGKM